MDYTLFKQKVLPLINIDLNSYKEQQMQRRIKQWIIRHNLNSFDNLVTELKNNKNHKMKFLDYLTINTSHFFRDEKVFAVIENDILPKIATNNKAKIWSAGCSIGAEIYSIALLLQEHKLPFSMLLASDIDDGILSKAKEGIYLENQLTSVHPKLLKKYFYLKAGKFHVQEEIKELITFKKHNLLTDSYERNLDLILCRNVFIYFTSKVQQKLIYNFIKSLKHNGYFIVGSAEQIMNPSSFGLTRVSYCIYQKTH